MDGKHASVKLKVRLFRVKKTLLFPTPVIYLQVFGAKQNYTAASQIRDAKAARNVPNLFPLHYTIQNTQSKQITVLLFYNSPVLNVLTESGNTL